MINLTVNTHYGQLNNQNHYEIFYHTTCSCIKSTIKCSKQYKISTVDFVQIIDNNKAEALHYYHNNWKVLREMATKKGFIDSYQFLEVSFTEDAPFHFMLITTYSNKTQFDKREVHFRTLIDERGDLSLLNEKKPGEFRKIVFNKEEAKHH